LTHRELASSSASQLAARFAELAVAQDQALLNDQIGKANVLFDQLEAVEAELRRRPGDQRRVLLELYGHPNMQVRVKAAKATLAIAPEAARELLGQISASGHGAQALEAGMSLWNLDRGVFRPT
jgi:hypothetical protein